MHPVSSAPAGPPAVQARIGRVVLGGRAVLSDCALALPAGRWTAVVGPNGAGKSTLLRALAGLQACEGQCWLAGLELHSWAPKARARQLAWLGQAEVGAEDLRAEDVVMLGRLPHQAWLAPPSAQDQAAVRQAMEETQCWPWRHRLLGSLSGGERQRVLLARALAVQAPVLLMDEPLAHLDPPHQADWISTVLRLRARGVTVISVLHELNVALMADDLVVLGQGRLLHHGPAQGYEAHAALREVFEHRIELCHVQGQWVALPRLDPLAPPHKEPR